MCSEALANVARHAQASRAAVMVEHAGDALELMVSDDGRGGAALTRGLRGLADRVDALGGTIVVSRPVGGPTAIRARRPMVRVGSGSASHGAAPRSSG
jgi:signal transduction histidine kinase